MTEIKLKPLSKSGQPPKTRLSTAGETAAIVDQLIYANRKRGDADAEVKGMIDGNPPFYQPDLDALAQSWRTNTNWRVGEAFVLIALSIYWDLVSEAYAKATCTTEWGESSGQSQDWSGIITEEFERLNKRDSSLNNMFRDSQHDMVLYRMGPVLWEDAFDFRAATVKCSNLLVPDGTKSDINKWKLAVILSNYTADELYSFIRHEESATLSGWNVAWAKKLLMDSVPLSLWPKNRRNDWEWYQQRIRNNDISWGMQTDHIPVAYVFVKEFAQPGDEDGRISQFAVVEGIQNDHYLFEHIGRYENWRQVICPFYYDTGDGEHHSVKGLGIKAYGALETINRLMCHEVDLAMVGSGMNFQFRSAADKENMQLMQLGPVNFWPEGVNFLQTTNTNNLIQAPSFVRNEILSTLTSNLAQYRQGLEREKGNPLTAREVNWRAENQNFIARSGVTYYFEQEDDFYAERFRRAANPNLTERNCGGKEALEFQKRCRDRGVPREALQKMASITATRTVGYGSADARLQSLMRLMMRLPMYGEAGRARILEDVTAADVGHTLMRRYMPESGTSNAIEFQKAQAQDKVGLIKLGMQPLITSDQNPLIYAETFILAAAQAMESVQQGGNPMEVIAFVDGAGRAAAQQLQRIADDPTRQEAYDALTERLEQLGRAKDQLEQMLQKQMQKNGQQQRKTQAAMTDEQIKTAKAANDISRKERKLGVDLSAKSAKTKQQLAIADVKMAREIAREDVANRDGDISE